MARIKTAPADASIPRYRLKEKAYIDDILYEPEAMPIDDETDEPKPLYINYRGIPGYHMEAANDAARAMVAKYPERMHFVDPILAMTQVGANDSVQTLIDQMAKIITAKA
jgi:hypothetical protein